MECVSLFISLAAGTKVPSSNTQLSGIANEA
jgi:hypothetical protein